MGEAAAARCGGSRPWAGLAAGRRELELGRESLRVRRASRVRVPSTHEIKCGEDFSGFRARFSRSFLLVLR